MKRCMGLCEYYETYTGFSPARTYEEYKRCSTCVHIVRKSEFPDDECYCCNSKYRVVGRTNRSARRLKLLSQMRQYENGVEEGEENFLTTPTIIQQYVAINS